MLSQRTLKATPKYGKSLMTVTIRRSSVNDSLLHRALLKSFVTRMKYVSRSAWTWEPRPETRLAPLCGVWREVNTYCCHLLA